METAGLTILFQLISLALKWFGAKQDTLAAFEKLVEASHNDGLISAETRDVFLLQKQKLLDDLAKEGNT